MLGKVLSSGKTGVPQDQDDTVSSQEQLGDVTVPENRWLVRICALFEIRGVGRGRGAVGPLSASSG